MFSWKGRNTELGVANATRIVMEVVGRGTTPSSRRSCLRTRMWTKLFAEIRAMEKGRKGRSKGRAT